MEEKPVSVSISCPVDLHALTTPPAPSAESIFSQMQINQEILTSEQICSLESLHRENLAAFNDDMSEGFQDPENPYYATFAFRDENRAPPHKVWAPQFSRKCLDLLQAKCDEMEASGILADPTKHNEDVRLVHSCFIQQKGRAKHKLLDQCALDELRLIACFNSLNDSIHPVPGRSCAYNDLLKFEARNKYTIHADLTNSYFQVKVHKKFWRYMGIMTPYRGIRVFTRLAQGLLNSDVHLEQVVTRVLGDQMLAGKCVIARDDLIVGGNSIDECLTNWAEILAKMNKHNLKLNPKKVTNKAAKGKYKFLQKYYHRGAFFLDKEENVFSRDVTSATLEDKFDKTVLPKVMQVKNFGRSGRTKYTHLVEQDTTQMDAAWSQETQQNLKFQMHHAAGMKNVFERPSAKKKK